MEVPAADAPAKPKAKSKPAKPAGFSKPAGFGKKAVVQEPEEEEEKPVHPSILVCAVAAVLAMLVAFYMQYSIDQNMSRQSEPVLGWPSAGDDASADEGSSEEEAEEESADEEE